MKNIIIDLQSSDTSKIQLRIAINIFSYKNTGKERVMHAASYNIKFASYNNANEVVDKFFESLCSIYQENLETSMGRSDFAFDSVWLIHCKCHKLNFKRVGSCTGSPDWIKKKNTTTNLKNTDHNFFQ